MSEQQTQVDYKVLNIAKLRTFAKQQGLENVGKMKKPEIVSALEGRPEARARVDNIEHEDHQPQRQARPVENKKPVKEEESDHSEQEDHKPTKPRSVNMRLLKADVKKAIMACNDHQLLFIIVSSLSE